MAFKEYSFKTKSYSNELIPETVLDQNDPVHQLQQLSGINNIDSVKSFTSVTEQANEKIKYQNNNNIQPGTPEWFRLWFSKPGLTNENPF